MPRAHRDWNIVERRRRRVIRVNKSRIVKTVRGPIIEFALGVSIQHGFHSEQADGIVATACGRVVGRA